MVPALAPEEAWFEAWRARSWWGFACRLDSITFGTVRSFLDWLAEGLKAWGGERGRRQKGKPVGACKPLLLSPTFESCTHPPNSCKIPALRAFDNRNSCYSMAWISFTVYRGVSRGQVLVVISLLLNLFYSVISIASLISNNWPISENGFSYCHFIRSNCKSFIFYLRHSIYSGATKVSPLAIV